MRTLIIVPTYNERENVRQLVSQVHAVVPTAEVLVVDDGSPDGTADEVRALQLDYAGVTLLERQERGLGTAYGAGLRWGLEQGFDALVTMDADLSHDARYLPAMLAAAEHQDLVIGCRYIRDGGTVNWRIRRILLSWLANRFARFVLGLRGHDFTSGYRIYRRTLVERIDLASIRSDGYSYLVEMLYVAQKAGATVAEVPIIFFDRRMGSSKISRREIYRGALTLLRLRFRHGKQS